jgi:hypothetical protein
LGGGLKLDQVDLVLIDREILLFLSENRIGPIVRCMIIGALRSRIAPMNIKRRSEETQIEVGSKLGAVETMTYYCSCWIPHLIVLHQV